MKLNELKQFIKEEIESIVKEQEIPNNAIKLDYKGFVFLIWENEKVELDSDGKWQGKYLQKDGSYSMVTKPSSLKYGYKDKKEVVKELYKLALEMYNNTNSSNTPYRLGGEKLINKK